MKPILLTSGNYFDSLFNEKNVRKVELLILRAAVFAFLLHLIIIFLGNNFTYFQNFQHSYLKAILLLLNIQMQSYSFIQTMKKQWIQQKD